MEEIWKDILGYEGIYQVSNHGRVKALEKPRYSRFKTHGHTIPEKILSLMELPNGYLKLTLVRDKIRKNQSVHRLVAEAFIPNPENKPCVNHIDCIKSNNNVENLEWCTPQENVNHTAKLNRFNPKRGSQHPCSVVTEEMVREIRSLNFSPKDSDMIFNRFGIKYHSAWKIKTRRCWAHITD